MPIEEYEELKRLAEEPKKYDKKVVCYVDSFLYGEYYYSDFEFNDANTEIINRQSEEIKRLQDELSKKQKPWWML